MSLVKNFDGFIFEGSYDKLTGDIASAVMRKIKETNTGEEYFGGVKVIYKSTDEVPGLAEMIDKGKKKLMIGDFIDDVSGLDLTVFLSVIRDQDPVYDGQFVLDGETDDQNSIIYIYISLGPGSEPRVYSEIAFDLRNLIRHEIEHLTQRGYGTKVGKKMRRNEAAREKIKSNPALYYKYYKLEDEIPANLHGIYSEAKSRKVPFKDMVNAYLDKKVQQGIIPPIEKMRIYRLWKAAAEKIGGLPPL